MAKDRINNNKVYSSVNLKHCLPISIEGVRVDVRIADKRFTLACIYRTPGVSNIDNSEFISAIGKTFEGDSEPIIFDDFNYPEIDWSQLATSRCSTAAEGFLLGHAHCYQMVKTNTRQRGDSLSLLDLLLVRDDKLVTEIQTLPPLVKVTTWFC
ncbi:hypothetical protein HHI36_006678 [Cryptolaemus montrouzieri]|uniref:Endonuclease/exonuclease/phosphatase domain-containing protein n=1 Tax=Cryptolaemus montrouzieri TaxID=559131 RepID=A0ABD2NYL1_9CUCU